MCDPNVSKGLQALQGALTFGTPYERSSKQGMEIIDVVMW